MMMPLTSEDCCGINAKLNTKCLGIVNISKMLFLLPSGWEKVAMMSHSCEYTLTFAIFFHFNPSLLAKLVMCLPVIKEAEPRYHTPPISHLQYYLMKSLVFWNHYGCPIKSLKGFNKMPINKTIAVSRPLKVKMFPIFLGNASNGTCLL